MSAGSAANPYLELLPRLRRQMWTERIGAPSLLAVGALWSLLLHPLWQLMLHSYWPVIPVLLGLNAVYFAVFAPRTTQSMHSLWEQLTTSGVAQRLVAGNYTDEGDPYFSNFPRWLNFVVPQGSTWSALVRISRNLSWYLGPPRPVLGHSAPAGFISLMLGVFGFSMVWYYGHVGPTVSLIAVEVLVLAVLQTCGMALTERYLGSWFLYHYLKYAWIDVPATSQDAAAEVKEQIEFQQALGTNPRLQQMLMFLNQLDQDLERMDRSMQISSVTWLVFLPFMQLGLPGFFHSQAQWWPLAICVGVLLLASSLIGVVNRRWASRYHATVSKQLKESQLALLMFTETDDDRDIQKYVPWPFKSQVNRPPMPKGYADGLRKKLWRICHNLDWYLAPPRRLLRASWVLAPLGLIIAAAGMLGVSFFAVGNLHPRLRDWLLLLVPELAALVLAGIASRDNIKAVVGRIELIRYLRASLAN